MSDSCCLIRPLESDSEFSLPKQRSKVVAHKPPRIQYCGGPGDAHPTHSSSQLATPSANGYSKELHLVREVLRIRGHIDHAHHIQLASQEILVTDGLPQAILHQNIRNFSHLKYGRRSISSGKNLWKMMSEVFGEWGNGFKVNPQTWML